MFYEFSMHFFQDLMVGIWPMTSFVQTTWLTSFEWNFPKRNSKKIGFADISRDFGSPVQFGLSGVCVTKISIIGACYRIKKNWGKYLASISPTNIPTFLFALPKSLIVTFHYCLKCVMLTLLPKAKV